MMRACRLGMVALAFAGCARAELRDGEIDARIEAPPVDAAADAALPMIDAPIMMQLAQTQDNVVTGANVSCVSNQTGNPTTEVSMYRVFALTDHSIANRPFHIKEVVFGVRESVGAPSVQVKIGLFNGTMGGTTLDLAQITPAVSASVNAMDTLTGLTMTVPLAVTIPPNGQFVVEIFSPNLAPQGKRFFVGGSPAAELANRGGYYRAPLCNRATPTTLAAAGFPQVHPVIAVQGVY